MLTLKRKDLVGVGLMTSANDQVLTAGPRTKTFHPECDGW